MQLISQIFILGAFESEVQKRCIFNDNFCQLSIKKKYVAGIHYNRLVEAILMSTNLPGFTNFIRNIEYTYTPFILYSSKKSKDQEIRFPFV